MYVNDLVNKLNALIPSLKSLLEYCSNKRIAECVPATEIANSIVDVLVEIREEIEGKSKELLDKISSIDIEKLYYIIKVTEDKELYDRVVDIIRAFKFK